MCKHLFHLISNPKPLCISRKPEYSKEEHSIEGKDVNLPDCSSAYINNWICIFCVEQCSENPRSVTCEDFPFCFHPVSWKQSHSWFNFWELITASWEENFWVGCRLQERRQCSGRIWNLLTSGCENNILDVPSAHNQCTRKKQTKPEVEAGIWKEGLCGLVDVGLNHLSG